jgi:8-oxo-dGTP pyrophosphatase MutT (NUDIX family)
MHHRKLDKWLQPGGHCDGDENVLNVAIKEAQEESGIQSITPITEDIFDVDVHLIPANSRDEAHYHYDVRFLLKAGVDRLIQNHESKELRWVELSNYQELDLMPSIQRLAHKACSFLKEA